AQWKRRRLAVDKPIPSAALLVGGAVQLFDDAKILVHGPTARYLLGTGDVLQRALRPLRTGEGGRGNQGGKDDSRSPDPRHVVFSVPKLSAAAHGRAAQTKYRPSLADRFWMPLQLLAGSNKTALEPRTVPGSRSSGVRQWTRTRLWPHSVSWARTCSPG